MRNIIYNLIKLIFVIVGLFNAYSFFEYFVVLFFITFIHFAYSVLFFISFVLFAYFVLVSLLYSFCLLGFILYEWILLLSHILNAYTIWFYAMFKINYVFYNLLK